MKKGRILCFLVLAALIATSCDKTEEEWHDYLYPEYEIINNSGHKLSLSFEESGMRGSSPLVLMDGMTGYNCGLCYDLYSYGYRSSHTSDTVFITFDDTISIMHIYVSEDPERINITFTPASHNVFDYQAWQTEQYHDYVFSCMSQPYDGTGQHHKYVFTPEDYQAAVAMKGGEK